MALVKISVLFRGHAFLIEALFEGGRARSIEAVSLRPQGAGGRTVFEFFRAVEAVSKALMAPEIDGAMQLRCAYPATDPNNPYSALIAALSKHEKPKGDTHVTQPV